MPANPPIQTMCVNSEDCPPFTRNVLRHSFLSYSPPIVKSADQVALEAGNSPAIVFKHYRELATETEATEWFNIFRSVDAAKRA